MKVVFLTAGTGSFYCGTCLRDNTLARALEEQGHEVVMVPLYLPLQTEEPDASAEIPIFFGGVNLYLSHRHSWFQKLPGWSTNWLNRRSILRAASKRQTMTDPEGLVELTLSMLAGLDGGQADELRKLVAWLKSESKPDVVCLSNGLLLGCAKAIGEELQCPVVCTLQGEHSFIDPLPAPLQSKIWGALAQRSDDVDHFFAVSSFFKDMMSDKLQLNPERISVVHNGIDFQPEPKEDDSPNPTIGYLARICPEKGLDILLDAVALLKGRPVANGLRIKIAGTVTRDDRTYLREIEERIAQLGLSQQVSIEPNLSPEGKQRFFRTLSVFTVPNRQPEAFGLYLLEAMAAGVPVIAPRLGAAEEILHATKGGVLFEPENPESLAACLSHMLSNVEEARELGRAGASAVNEHFRGNNMASGFSDAVTPLLHS